MEGIQRIKIVNRLILVSASAFGILLTSAAASQAEIRTGSYNNKIAYATGGFASEEQQEMKAQSTKFNVHLTFASAKDRAYLADVSTKILNEKREPIFEDTNTGPFMFLNLPHGDYKAQLSYDGKSKIIPIRVVGTAAIKKVVTW